MKKKIIYLSLVFLLFLSHDLFSQDLLNSEQDRKGSRLFLNQEILPIKLDYSNKHIKKNTNDSTYITSDLSYKLKDGSWERLKVKIRARGNNRLKNCYFAPLKVKIKKSVAAGTLFEGNKKLKLVLPCLRQKDNNDNIVKEYMAYKLYELISPYHYKTRLTEIDLTEITGSKTKNHSLIGILIEDIDHVAKRNNGNVVERNLHPLAMDDLRAIQNDFFQFMIGNTDFSVAFQHNQKLLFANKKLIPVPYDFDMSGLVHANYANVSEFKDQSLQITDVTQRLFRGFKRDEKIYHSVRKQFLGTKIAMFEIIDGLELYFDDPNEFLKARNYIQSFYDIIENNQKFKSEIIQKARTK